jgi:hypothetical protein
MKYPRVLSREKYNDRKKYTEIDRCRISGRKNLVTVLSLGEQYLTGVFPKSAEEEITKGPSKGTIELDTQLPCIS